MDKFQPLHVDEHEESNDRGLQRPKPPPKGDRMLEPDKVLEMDPRPVFL